MRNFKVIPHGFNEIFSNVKRTKNLTNPIVCTYISNTDMYKNQWNVVKSIEILRKKYNIILNLVGGGEGKSLKILKEQIQELRDEKIKIEENLVLILIIKK